MGTLRVAAFQRRPLFNDVAGIAERLQSDLEWCDREGVDLALFPECYLQGYEFERPALSAIAFEDESFRNLLDRLAAIRSTIIVGLIERLEQLVFNAAAVVRHGAVLGAYRKVHLHRKEKAFDAGRGCPIFGVAGWKFGINICYDSNFPDAAALIAAQGARLICYPINNLLPPDVAERWRYKSVESLRQRAIETGCWVMSADVVGEHQSMLCHGCSCIVDPAGEVVARVDEGTEGAALFDLVHHA